MDNTDVFKVLFCLIILSYASLSDIRTRSVSNIPWLVMALAGVALLVLGVVGLGTPLLVQAAVSIVSTSVIAYVFFWIGLFGAADAKSLMAMSVLFPEYPSFAVWSQRFPLFELAAPEIFPFALTTLMNATLLAMVVPLFLAGRNMLKLGPAVFWRNITLVFMGYPVQVAQLGQQKHVKLVHLFREQEGELTRAFAFGGVEINAETVERLQGFSREGRLLGDVWVMPELPFMVFITSGFVTAVLVGNLLLALAIRL